MFQPFIPICERAMKSKLIECRAIISVSDEEADSPAPRLEKAGWGWFDFLDHASSDDIDNRAKYAKEIEKYEPGIVDLAASIMQKGQSDPIHVRKIGKASYVVITGEGRK